MVTQDRKGTLGKWDHLFFLVVVVVFKLTSTKTSGFPGVDHGFAQRIKNVIFVFLVLAFRGSFRIYLIFLSLNLVFITTTTKS